MDNTRITTSTITSGSDPITDGTHLVRRVSGVHAANFYQQLKNASGQKPPVLKKREQQKPNKVNADYFERSEEPVNVGQDNYFPDKRRIKPTAFGGYTIK